MTIGSPNLNDSTARLEKILNNALKRTEKMVEDIIPKVVNRPLGSEKMSPDDQLRDYLSIKDDTLMLTDRLQQMMTQEGAERGREMWADWILDSEKLLNA
ncbi:hypothetical protein LCGC14_2484870 [marine sediment metagenome]|uniref:Uncharacterized protein n=1 Tax=marine sediment metagenome TaxID=412755 RepID=A0A0F9BUA7_9ZZZZ